MLHIYLSKPALIFFSSVQSHSCVWLFATWWTAERQASRLQSPSAVILEPPKIKSDTVSTVSPSIPHEVMVEQLMRALKMEAIYKPWRRLSPENKFAETLIMDF